MVRWGCGSLGRREWCPSRDLRVHPASLRYGSLHRGTSTVWPIRRENFIYGKGYIPRLRLPTRYIRREGGWVAEIDFVCSECFVICTYVVGVGFRNETTHRLPLPRVFQSHRCRGRLTRQQVSSNTPITLFLFTWFSKPQEFNYLGHSPTTQEKRRKRFVRRFRTIRQTHWMVHTPLSLQSMCVMKRVEPQPWPTLNWNRECTVEAREERCVSLTSDRMPSFNPSPSIPPPSRVWWWMMWKDTWWLAPVKEISRYVIIIFNKPLPLFHLTLSYYVSTSVGIGPDFNGWTSCLPQSARQVSSLPPWQWSHWPVYQTRRCTILQWWWWLYSQQGTSLAKTHLQSPITPSHRIFHFVS